MITSVSNPRWADEQQTIIDCIITTEATGDEQLPFTASPSDTEPSGRKVFEDCVAEVYGPVAAYSPPPEPPAPPPPSADQNRTKAIAALQQTDWTVQPDVGSADADPRLLNQADFIAYRSALRRIAVNPQPGHLTWPSKPAEVWSE